MKSEKGEGTWGQRRLAGLGAPGSFLKGRLEGFFWRKGSEAKRCWRSGGRLEAAHWEAAGASTEFQSWAVRRRDSERAAGSAMVLAHAMAAVGSLRAMVREREETAASREGPGGMDLRCWLLASGSLRVHERMASSHASWRAGPSGRDEIHATAFSGSRAVHSRATAPTACWPPGLEAVEAAHAAADSGDSEAKRWATEARAAARREGSEMESAHCEAVSKPRSIWRLAREARSGPRSFSSRDAIQRVAASGLERAMPSAMPALRRASWRRFWLEPSGSLAVALAAALRWARAVSGSREAQPLMTW